MLIQRLNILLIEDDDTIIEALRRSFARLGSQFSLTVTSDGPTALAVLCGQLEHPPLARPYLILLDLSLPIMDGLAFLTELRRDPRLCTSIVFVLTYSSTDVDKLATYQCGIAGYFDKTKLGAGFEDLTSFLTVYCTLVEFPET
jgi:CheY-like chemotaxis protein